jgi:hypothetical protein
MCVVAEEGGEEAEAQPVVVVRPPAVLDLDLVLDMLCLLHLLQTGGEQGRVGVQAALAGAGAAAVAHIARLAGARGAVHTATSAEAVVAGLGGGVRGPAAALLPSLRPALETATALLAGLAASHCRSLEAEEDDAMEEEEQEDEEDDVGMTASGGSPLALSGGTAALRGFALSPSPFSSLLGQASPFPLAGGSQGDGGAPYGSRAPSPATLPRMALREEHGLLR